MKKQAESIYYKGAFIQLRATSNCKNTIFLLQKICFHRPFAHVFCPLKTHSSETAVAFFSRVSVSVAVWSQTVQADGGLWSHAAQSHPERFSHVAASSPGQIRLCPCWDLLDALAMITPQSTNNMANDAKLCISHEWSGC